MKTMLIRGAISFGRFGSTRGVESRNAKFTADQVLEIYRSPLSESELASKYKVAVVTIRNIKRKKTYFDITSNEPKHDHCE